MTDTDTLKPSPVVDPDAPFGRRKDGTPYKRDPGPFAHLRGKAFGSMNGTPKPPTQRLPRGSSKPRASAVPAAPPKLDAAGYATKIRQGILGFAKFASRKAPAPAIILAVRSDDMAESWGRVAVSYPRVGRTIDRLSKTGDLGDAIGSTVMTLGMMAMSMGLLADTPLGDLLEEVVVDTLREFEESDEFAKMREKMAERADRAARQRAEVAVVDGDIAA